MTTEAPAKRRGARRLWRIAGGYRQPLWGNFVVAGQRAWTAATAVAARTRGREAPGPRSGRVRIAKKVSGGKAGGKPDLAQGSIPDFSPEKLRKLL